MKNLGQKFRKNTGLSPYIWIVFYILPFYFIFQESTSWQVGLGITMIIGFFLCYILSFASHGWIVYIGASMQIVISIAMSVFFGYIYFFLFLAFFIGNLRRKAAFITFYVILLVSTFASSYYGFWMHEIFITQLPFVFLCIIAVILVPVNTYNKNKEEELHEQLHDANERIADLVKMEERQRISRDLHDTLGQKLSLIGLKSDLASKLVVKNPEKAQQEIKDVQHTARLALKEVRELVMEMRGTKIDEEIHRVEQILDAANISFSFTGPLQLPNSSLIAENVLSMCIKEAVTNVVKHSSATTCSITVEPSKKEVVVKIKDNGIGLDPSIDRTKKSGLKGMNERLEFVNGTLEVISDIGTTIILTMPTECKGREKEVNNA